MELELFTIQLRSDFEEETGDSYLNEDKEFDIDYVAFVEKKLFEAMKNNRELLNALVIEKNKK